MSAPSTPTPEPAPFAPIDFGTWESTPEAARIEDPLQKIQAYDDRTRKDLFKAGLYDADAEQEIINAGADQALRAGLITDPAEYAPAAKPRDPNFLARQLSFKGDTEKAQSVYRYQAFLADPSTDPETLERARKEAELAPDQENELVRAAVRTGELPFAIVPDAEGNPVFEIDPELGEPTREDIVDLAGDSIDPRFLPELERQLTKVPGTNYTPARFRQAAVFEKFIQGHAKTDDFLTGELERAQKEFDRDGELSAETQESLDRSLSSLDPDRQFSPEARGRYIRDMVRKGARPEAYDPENPQQHIQYLEDGTVWLPEQVIFDQAKHDEVLGTLKISPEQKENAMKMRAGRLESLAPAYVDAMGANPDALDFFEKSKAEGKSDVDIATEWYSKPENYSQVANRARSFGMSLLEAGPGLVQSVAALAGSDSALEALQARGENVARNEEYARLFGDSYGVGQTLANTAAQVAVDLLAGMAVSAVATPVAGVAVMGARVAAQSLVRGLARSAVTAASRSTVKSFLREGATTAAKTIASLGDDAAASMARAVGGQTGIAASSFTRSAGSAYVQAYGALDAQVSPNGTPKYSDEEKRKIALGAGITAGAATAAITLGFGKVLGQGAEGAITPGILRRVYGMTDDQIVGGVRTAGLAVLKAAGAEAPEEAVDQLVGNVIQSVTTGEDFRLGKALKEALEAGLVGGLMGGSIGAIQEGAGAYRSAKVKRLEAVGAPATAAALEATAKAQAEAPADPTTELQQASQDLDLRVTELKAQVQELSGDPKKNAGKIARAKKRLAEAAAEKTRVDFAIKNPGAVQMGLAPEGIAAAESRAAAPAPASAPTLTPNARFGDPGASPDLQPGEKQFQNPATGEWLAKGPDGNERLLNPASAPQAEATAAPTPAPPVVLNRRASALSKVLTNKGVSDGPATRFAAAFSKNLSPDTTLEDARGQILEAFRTAGGKFADETADTATIRANPQTWIDAGYTPEESEKFAELAAAEIEAAQEAADAANESVVIPEVSGNAQEPGIIDSTGGPDADPEVSGSAAPEPVPDEIGTDRAPEPPDVEGVPTDTAPDIVSAPPAEVVPQPKFSAKARAVVEKLLTPAAKLFPAEYFRQQKAATPEQTAIQGRVAAMYEALPIDDSANPEVVQAYRNLVVEVTEQYRAMLATGLKVVTGGDNPYATSRDTTADVERGRLWVHKTDRDSFGSDPALVLDKHPMLAATEFKDDNGVPLLANDVFRAVHDYVTHAAFGVSFGPLGEEAAWRTHLATIKDPLARRALTTETRGQNSWVNYRPAMVRDGLPIKKGQPGYIAPQDRPFATQKVALLPEEALSLTLEGAESKLGKVSDASLAAEMRKGNPIPVHQPYFDDTVSQGWVPTRNVLLPDLSQRGYGGQKYATAFAEAARAKIREVYPLVPVPAAAQTKTLKALGLGDIKSQNKLVSIPVFADGQTAPFTNDPQTTAWQKAAGLSIKIPAGISLNPAIDANPKTGTVNFAVDSKGVRVFGRGDHKRPGSTIANYKAFQNKLPFSASLSTLPPVDTSVLAGPVNFSGLDLKPGETAEDDILRYFLVPTEAGKPSRMEAAVNAAGKGLDDATKQSIYDAAERSFIRELREFTLDVNNLSGIDPTGFGFKDAAAYSAYLAKRAGVWKKADTAQHWNEKGRPTHLSFFVDTATKAHQDAQKRTGAAAAQLGSDDVDQATALERAAARNQADGPDEIVAALDEAFDPDTLRGIGKLAGRDGDPVASIAMDVATLISKIEGNPKLRSAINTALISTHVSTHDSLPGSPARVRFAALIRTVPAAEVLVLAGQTAFNRTQLSNISGLFRSLSPAVSTFTDEEVSRNREDNTAAAADLQLDGDLRATIERIARSAKYPRRYRAVALAALKMQVLPTIALVDAPAEAYAGSYLHSARLITLNMASSNGRGLLDVLAHELLHAATIEAVANPQTKAARDLRTKLEIARQKAAEVVPDDMAYAVSSLDEFITHAATDPRFQVLLRETLEKGKTTWQRVVDAVAKFFGIANNDFVSDLWGFINHAAEYGYRAGVAASREPAQTSDALFAPASRRNQLRVRLTREALTNMALEQESWKDWYSSHQETLDEFFGDHADTFQSILAATSQRSEVKSNVSLALRAFGQWVRGEAFSGFLPAVISNLEKLRSELQVGGQKISAFRAANEGDADQVVVDMHISGLLFGNSSPSKAQFEKATKVLTEIAGSLGWKPSQVQAALWAASIVKSGKTPESYADYLKRLESKSQVAPRIGAPIAGSPGSDGTGGDRGRFAPRGAQAGLGNAADGDPGGGVDQHLPQLPEGLVYEFDESNPRFLAYARRSKPGVVSINRASLAAVIEGLDPANARAIISKVVKHEIGHLAAFNAFTGPEISEMAADLSMAELQDIARRYYDTPDALARLTADLESGATSEEALVEEYLRMQLELATDGSSTEATIAFHSINPGFVARLTRYLKDALTGLWRTVAGPEDYVSRVAISRLAREYRAILRGHAPERVVPFDPADPRRDDRYVAAFYRAAPDNLMGFSSDSSRQKGFDDPSGYRTVIAVRYTFPDGTSDVDTIRGLNTTHALERARRNWDGAEIELVSDIRYASTPTPRPDLDADTAIRETFVESVEDFTTPYKPGETWRKLFVTRTGDRRFPAISDKRQSSLVANERLVFGRRKQLNATIKEEKPDAQVLAAAAGDTSPTTTQEQDAYIAMEFAAAMAEARGVEDPAGQATAVAEAYALKQRLTTAAYAETARIKKRRIDDAFAELERTAPKTAANLKAMREGIDNISRILKEYQPDASPLRMVLDTQDGIYLTRVYRLHHKDGNPLDIFGDPTMADVRERAQDELMESFIQYRTAEIIEQEVEAGKIIGETEARDIALAEAKEQDLGRILLEDYILSHGSKALPHNGSDYRTDLTRFFKKMPVPEALRDVLEEVMDPVELLTRTALNVGMLAASTVFTRDLARAGFTSGAMVTGQQWASYRKLIQEPDNDKYLSMLVDNGWAKRKPAAGYVEVAPDVHVPAWLVKAKEARDLTYVENFRKVAATTKKADAGQLADLYAHPDVADWMDHQFTKQKAVSTDDAKLVQKLGEVFAKATGTSLGIATLGSVGFYSRNLVGTAFFLAANGINPFSAKSMRASKLAVAAFLNQESGEVTKLTGIGVLNDDLRPETIKELLKGETDQPGGLNILELIGKTLGGKKGIEYGTKTTAGLAKLAELATAIDGIAKATAYYAELETLREAYPDKSAKWHEDEAAKVVKLTHQAKSQTPPVIDSLTSSSYGRLMSPYLRFKGEMFRLTGNIIAQSAAEIRSDNPAIRARGYKRASGFAMIAAFSVAGPALISAMYGVGDDEEFALRKALPNYLRGNSIIYIPSADGKSITSLDFTYLNPYSFVGDPISRMGRAVMRGEPGDGIDELAIWMNSSFLSEQILAGAVMEVLRNKTSDDKPITFETDSADDKLIKFSKHLVGSSFTPQSLRALQRSYDTARRGTPEDAPFFETAAGIVIGHGMPIRPRAFETEALALRAARTQAETNRQVRALAGQLKRRVNFTEGDIEDIVADLQDSTASLNQDIARMISGYEGLGLGKAAIAKQLVEAGRSREFARAIVFRGVAAGPAITPATRRDMFEAGEAAGGPGGGEKRIRAVADAMRQYEKVQQVRVVPQD